MKYKDSDFKIETTKGTGPGGQHKNKVETYVKITHIATGLIQTCQETRSKIKNLEIAKKKLIERLQEIERLKELSKQNELRREQINNGDRSYRRRTYNFKTGIVKELLLQNSVTIIL